MCRRHVRLRRNDDLVARADPQMQISQMQCRCARTCGDGEGGLREVGKALLELVDARPVREDRARQDLQNGLAFLFANDGPAEGDVRV